MKAGPMRYKLRLLMPVKIVDGFGSDDISYTTANTVWAERVSLTGRQSIEVGEMFPDYTVRFRIRDGHRVDENWRVEQLGGYLYTVTAIEPNVARGFKTLICERVNP